MENQNAESEAVSMDYKFVAKVSLWSAFGSFLFVLFLFVVVEPTHFPMLLAASGLIPIGGGVVGALLALSMTDDTEH